jgi:DNA-binding NarL/FixJ family response regulator
MVAEMTVEPGGTGPQAPGPVRVLVVDDSAMVREGLTAFLGCEADLLVVGACTDGAEVPEAVERLHPDVVVMDLSMPLVDGLTATRALRAAHPEIRVVVLTGEQPWARAAALDAGASGFVEKSADPADLLAALRDVTAGSWS